MSKKRILIILGVFALLISTLSAPAAGSDTIDAPVKVEASSSGSYIVVMEAEPLVASVGQDSLNTPKAERERKKMKKSHDKALEAVGASTTDKVNTYTNALNGFSATLTVKEANELANLKGVVRVVPDELRQLTTDSSPGYLGLDGKKEAWDSGLTGEGVVVGVIDSGIWPEHPSFADDGSYAPASILPLDDVRPACEFGNLAHNAEDAAFTCNNKLIGARQMLDTYRSLIGAESFEFDSARDDDGHGTHTASTAAGNAGVEAHIYGQDLGEISGIAPRAHVIAYKGLGFLGGFGSDLAAAIDQAVFDGVDVINYSVGGGPSLAGADDIAFLFAADAGVFVATSAGNSGPGAATVGGPGTVPWITTVGASTQERFFEGMVQYGNAGQNQGASKGKGTSPMRGGSISGASITLGTTALPFVDAEFAGGDLCIPGDLDPGKVTGKIVLCRRGAIARADKSLAVEMAGGAGMVMYNNSNTDNLFTDTHHVPSVHIDYTDGLALKDYIAAADVPMAEIKTGTISKWKQAPSMTIFSSRGPNAVAGDLIKPDVTAPGLQILAGNTPVPNSGVPGELFQAIAGTSMSSPHVAGLFALIKQAHPDWSAAAAKSAIMTTAHQDVVDNDRTSPAGPFEMGSGHVDPGKVDADGSMFNPGLVYDAGLFEYAAFTCGADLGVFTPGSCAFLGGLGIPFDASDLNLASIGVAELAGSQTVVRTVTSVADETRTWSASVSEPTGYDIVVSPSEITLAPGELATFEVTITNDGSAPAGDWRFGSLEWKSGGFVTYSPIAVNGALFDAPPAVTGTGTSGSTSFDVLFGYDGAYTAADHGLIADAPESGDISQDPGQDYTPGEVSPGVDYIEFTVTGSAFVRWSLVIPGPDDIDLFLHGPGAGPIETRPIIATSTNGGTDELIELVLPGDGTYTMAVHGWSIPSEPLAYTLHFWDVPATPGGGSLSIDSAPASASVGAVGTIDISWTGLVAGVDYLGAVSHSDSGGIIGITLVEVSG